MKRRAEDFSLLSKKAGNDKMYEMAMSYALQFREEIIWILLLISLHRKETHRR